MKTLTLAAIRSSLMFTAVAALSLAYPASVQAVPTTYLYTGNPFTFVEGAYTTSDFVSVMVTLAGPLGANMPLTQVSPTAFTVSDGVQTITKLTANSSSFAFQTNGIGGVTMWAVVVHSSPVQQGPFIPTFNTNLGRARDTGGLGIFDFGEDNGPPGTWTRASVPDAASTFTLLYLSLTALGVAARRFKRPPA